MKCRKSAALLFGGILFIFSFLSAQTFTGRPTSHEPTVPSSGSWAGARVAVPDYLKNQPVAPRPSQWNFTGGAFLENLGLITSIEGITFNEDASNSGYYHIPPDPSGAAGPDYLVSVVNTSIEWFTKGGVQQHSESLANFFSPLSPQTGTFDPKVIYDQYEDRFVVVTLERQDSPKTSKIFLAVSATSDPNGSWYFLEINSLLTISGTDTWADYPGFAVDEEAVYITANMFGFTSGNYGVRLWIVDKGAGSGGFYDGGAASVNMYDPYTESGHPNDYSTTQPAHVFGAPTGFGTFLVAYSGWSDGTNEFLNTIRVDNPLSSPNFTQQWVSLGDIDDTGTGFSDAPQSGSSYTIETNDRRSLQAVWRNNTLYTVAEVLPPSGADAGQVTAHWFQVNTSNLASLSIADQGNVGGEDIASGCYTFFPSIAVDKYGNIGIGFSASAPSIYPGAYYTGRLAGDAAGTVQPSEVLRDGVDYYYRAFGGSRNRWGDYTGMSVDPADDETFWHFNEYALTRGNVFPSYPSEDGRWGTAFGSFSFKVVANLKIFLEGPYSNGSMSTALLDGGYLPTSQPYGGLPWNYGGTESVSTVPAGVVDWVLVELRSGTAAATKVARRAGFLLSDGSVVDTDGSSLLRFEGIVPDDYYVVIYHRNHLAVMSAAPVTLASNSALYDFTTGTDKYYGSGGAEELETNVWGMIAGDGNSDGGVYAEDYTLYKTNQGAEGYKMADYNMDSGAYAEDYTIYKLNQGKETQVP